MRLSFDFKPLERIARALTTTTLMSKASAEQALEIYHIIRQEVVGEWTKTSIDTIVGMPAPLLLMMVLWISCWIRRRKQYTRRDTRNGATQRKEMDDATVRKLPDVLSSRLGTVAHQKRNCPTLQKALIVDLKVWCQVCSDRHSLEVI